MAEIDSKLEELERQYAIAKRRGDVAAAASALAQMREMAPDATVVLLADADELILSRKPKEALEMLATAVASRPDDKPLASRYAELVYEQKIGGVDVFDDAPASAFEEATTARASAAVSMLVPGLGQILSGDVPKGYMMTGGFITGAISLFLIPDGIQGFLKIVGFSRNPGVQFNALVLVPMFMIVVCYLWSMADAGSAAKRYKRTKIDRPAPPVDKDFEI
jgi:hypothetical protein